MPRAPHPISDTREALIDAAMRRLYDLGYNRFSFAHVAEDIGIKKASIHYHFPTKDALVLAALDKYIEEQQQFLRRLRDDPGLRPVEKFERIFTHAYEQMIARQYIGCLAGNLGLEISRTNEGIRARIQQFQQWKVALFVDLVRAGQASGDFRPTADPLGVAQAIFAAMEGGVATSRISKSAELLAIALTVCRNIVARELLPDR